MSMFSDFVRTGMAQALECAGREVIWVFEDGNERPITALVSEENSVQREAGGNRSLVKTRGLTLTEDETQALFGVKKPNQRQRFRVPDFDGEIQYQVYETVSRADGGTTIIGERIERRETVRPGHFIKG